MIFLYSTVSSLKSIFGMVVITSPSSSSHCPCWTSSSVHGCFGTGWLQLSSVVRFSSLSRSQSFGSRCLLLANVLLLPAVGFALLPAVGFALLGSFPQCSRSSMFFSRGSSYPCCFASFFSSFHNWLFGGGSVSVLLSSGVASTSTYLEYFTASKFASCTSNATNSACATS